MSLDNFVGHVVFLANKNDIPITKNMVSRVMFFALGHYLFEGGDRVLVRDLFENNFHKSPIGPIHLPTQRRFLILGDDPIILDDVVYVDRFSVLDRYILDLLTNQEKLGNLLGHFCSGDIIVISFEEFAKTIGKVLKKL